MNRENISPLVQEQFPEFFKEDQSSFPIFLEKYYEYLESLQVHFTDLQLNEYKPLLEGETGILLEEGSQVSDDTNNSIILESLRNVDEDGFSVGEIVTGSTSHATAKVLGVQKKGDDISGHSDNTVLHHIFLKPLTGKFVEGEVFTGSLYRTTAKIKHFDDKGVLNFSRQLENMSDVFYTDSDYVELFRKEYLENIEVGVKADLKRLVSVSNEIFRTRGSEKSYNWLWKVLYNDENLEFEYPKDSLFKVSDANWKKEDYLIVNNAGASNVGSFSGRTITGEVSGAIATVQSQAGFQRNPYELTKLFITDVTGNFQIGEKIIGSSVEGIQPTGYLLGVLDNIDILDGGTNYEIGDKLTISGGGGFDIEASVNTVVSGAINEIVIADGGDGYLGNEIINYFVPSGGSGAASETRTIQQSGTAKIFGGTSIVNNFTSVTIDAANYGGTLDGVNANSHFHSNSLNTFDMTVGSTTNYAVGHIIKDSTNQITGTVVSVPDATSIIYVIEDDTKPNFYPGENGSSISAFKTDGSAVLSTTTTVTAVTSVTDSQYFGALPLTTETPYGTIKTIEILTTGSNFDKKPDLTVQQNSIILFENNDEILGERSRFLNFDSNIEGLFQYGAEIQGADSGASGIILDPFLDNTANTIFSTLRFRPTATLLTLDSTDGSADAGDNILLEDGFHNGDGPQHTNAHSSYNASTSIAGQYRLEDSDFFAGETVDVTVGSANAVSAASNTVSIDNSFRGRNAVMQTGNLATGSISSLTVSNFGVGYTSAPTITADNAGDQNATFSATIGTLAEQPGGYTNESSLLSGKDKIQDSYYYQDYSYVLKTNTPINQFRDPVKTFVHPAGWALFGEIAIQSALTTPFEAFTNTEDNSRLIIELAAQNVNFLSTSSDVFEMTLRFIESSAAINVNSTYNQEYIYKFKDPGTGSSVSLNTFNKEYNKEINLATGQLVANPITSDNHIESSLSIGMTLDESNVTGERILYPFIGQTSFANERINTDTGDYLIRTTPSIQDWIDSFQVPDTNISNLGAYMSLVIGDLAAIEPKVANNSEIYLADINIALEDDNLLLSGPESQEEIAGSDGPPSLDFTGVSSVDIGTSSGDTGDDICLAYGDGVYVAMDDRKLYSSTDGSTWTERLDFTDSTMTLGNRKVDYSGGTFYATTAHNLYKSTNGTTWTSMYFGTGMDSTYTTCITSDGNSTESSRKIMAAGLVGAIRKSDDGGSTWTGGLGQDGTYNTSFFAIAYGEQSGTDYWAVASWTGSSPSMQHKLWYSDDFWSTKSTRTNVLSDFVIRGACYTGTNWIFVGYDGSATNGKIAVGSDITGTFTEKTPSGVLTGQRLYNVKMYGGHVFAVGEQVILASKDNGNNWTTLDDNSSLSGESIKDVAWSGTSNVTGNFVATGLDQYTIAPKYDSGTVAGQSAVAGDDGDRIMLEDGYDPTDSNYTASTSLNGAIIAEAGRVLQEDELAPTDAGYRLDFSDNGKLVIHQSEDHKYMVTSVNSTAFTVQTQHDGQFLNTNLNEWNVEHKFADNIA